MRRPPPRAPLPYADPELVPAKAGNVCGVFSTGFGAAQVLAVVADRHVHHGGNLWAIIWIVSGAAALAAGLIGSHPVHKLPAAGAIWSRLGLLLSSVGTLLGIYSIIS